MKRIAETALWTALALVGCKGPPKTMTTLSRYSFGQVDGRPVSSYVLVNADGLGLRVTDYGATVTHLQTPDRDGRFADIVLGFDTVEDYVQRSPYFGCTAGRCANRIAGARFELDGREYRLAANDPPHHLHGGLRGFDKVVWESQPIETPEGQGVRLWYDSPDGEEGYPGNLHAEVVYRLTDQNELRIEMSATTDAPTPVNLVHHTYWNLAGHDSGDVLDQELELHASRMTPGAPLVPSGAIEPVAGTPFDFRHPKPIGRDIAALPADESGPGGYDVNYVVDGEWGELRPVARAHDPGSGRTLELWADQPGVQLYTGNFLDGVRGKGGARYEKHAGFCLESQVFPDAIHHQGEPGWPSVVLRPGQTYRHVMVFRFGVDGGPAATGG